MDNKKHSGLRLAPMQTFHSKSLPIPAGTKLKDKLPRGEEMFVEPSYLKWWLLGGGAVTIALVVGVLVGRFVLR
jgi:hypothetical protein